MSKRKKGYKTMKKFWNKEKKTASKRQKKKLVFQVLQYETEVSFKLSLL